MRGSVVIVIGRSRNPVSALIDRLQHPGTFCVGASSFRMLLKFRNVFNVGALLVHMLNSGIFL